MYGSSLSVEAKTGDTLCGKILGRTRKSDLVRQICSSKCSPSWCGKIIGSWFASNPASPWICKAKTQHGTKCFTFAFSHFCTAAQGKNSDVQKSFSNIWISISRIYNWAQYPTFGIPLIATPPCIAFCSNISVPIRCCIGAMAFITAMRLAWQEIRFQQQTLEPEWILDPERLDKPGLYSKKTTPFFCTCIHCSKRPLKEKLKKEILGLVQLKLELEQLKLEFELVELVLKRLKLERIARLWRALEYLVLLLLSTLRFLLSCSRIGGFQNRERLRCTTMPWNIWPSLVVLWGVCWMFINTPLNEFDTTPSNAVPDDEQLSLFVPSKTFPFIRETFQIHWREVTDLSLDTSFAPNPFTPNFAGFDPFLGNFEFGNALNDAAYDHTPYLDHQTLNEIPLGSLQQNYQDQPSPREAEDYSIYSRSLPGDFSSNSDNRIKGTATPNFPIRQLHMNINQVANTHVSSHSLSSLSAAATTFGRPDSEAPLLQPISPISEQQQIPPRNAEGKLICTDPGCTDKTFRRYCDWQ